MYTKFILSGKNPGEIAGNCDKHFFHDFIILCPYYIYIFIAFKFDYYFTSRKQKTEKILRKLFLITNYFFSVKSFYFLGNFSVFPLVFPNFFLLFTYYLFIFLLQNIKRNKKNIWKGGRGRFSLSHSNTHSLYLYLFTSPSRHLSLKCLQNF